MITFSSCGHQSTDDVKKEFLEQHPIADDKITIYDGSPPILTRYGQAGVPYGNGRHPGIDYGIPIGTPIIAVSDGTVFYVGKPYNDKPYGGGFGVAIKHADQFLSVYAHLLKVFVVTGQQIKRGQLIGFSWKSYNYYPHLHFGLLKSDKKGSGIDFSKSYNPNKFWLNESPQCFDPNKDYSGYSFKEITLPVACGDYQRKLLLKKGKTEIQRPTMTNTEGFSIWGI
jgi:murein DD-endopeptidase MepM/ murein hydrolase activator NlpD